MDEPRLDDWYTIAEIVKKKGSSKQNINELIRTRQVKTIKKGNVLLVHKSELHKFD